MPGPARAGVLIYAKDLHRMATFYQTVLAMTVLQGSDDLVVLQSEDGQLLIHQIPPQIADQISIASPPELREETAIKPFFTVTTLAEAQQRATSLGGGILGQVWEGPGFRVSNAYDPEGNIIQLREPAG